MLLGHRILFKNGPLYLGTCLKECQGNIEISASRFYLLAVFMQPVNKSAIYSSFLLL